MTSITLGLVVVFALQDSGAVDTAKDTLSPAADIALGLILLVVASVLHSGRHEERAERRKEKKANKEEKTPRWREFMSKGKSRDTFVFGALLTLPGEVRTQQENASSSSGVLVMGLALVLRGLVELLG